MERLPEFLRGAAAARPTENAFDVFVGQIESYTSAPCHSMAELKAHAASTKMKGDLFEAFCCLYLKTKRGYREAWRLPDVPRDLAARLGVAGRDMGIDLVAVDAYGGISAVQCKYRIGTGFVPGKFIRRDVVPWKEGPGHLLRTLCAHRPVAPTYRDDQCRGRQDPPRGLQGAERHLHLQGQLSVLDGPGYGAHVVRGPPRKPEGGT